MRPRVDATVRGVDIGVKAPARSEEGAAAPWWQPWAAVAGFSFGGHFVWEFLHAPLYRGLAEGSHWDGIKCCVLATLGDVGIALVAYAAVAALTRNRMWLATPAGGAAGLRGPHGPTRAFILVGVVITIVIELLSVLVWKRWAYGPEMPVVLGVGLTPLLQWVVVPSLVLWLARRHLGQCAPRGANATPLSATNLETQS